MFTTPTLRDWFAGQAVAGYLAAHAGDETALPKKTEIAEYAYELADALLVRRGEDQRHGDRDARLIVEAGSSS